MVNIPNKPEADAESAGDISCLYAFEENRLRLQILLSALECIEFDFQKAADQLQVAARGVNGKDKA
jgi:hypothetical protein